MKTKAAFFNNCTDLRERRGVGYVYAQGRHERVAALTDLHPHVVSADNFEQHADSLAELEVVFSTWGMPALSCEQLRRLRALKAVFYAAGSVKGFARPFLEQGVSVVSAWVANGRAVAEFTLAQILLSCKGYFRNATDCSSPDKRRRGQVTRGNGVFGETVAVIGAGAIGRQVIELLTPFELSVVVVDPYLPDHEAARLGVRKVSLEQAFGEARVVSNHLPNLPEIRGLLNEPLFRAMRQGATFINTARGAQVVEQDLIQTLKARPDLTALLDVTDPEPPAPDSELYSLPNVQLSSHIAGAMNNEVVRLADCVIAEFEAWQSGRPLKYAVTLDMLEKMA